MEPNIRAYLNAKLEKARKDIESFTADIQALDRVDRIRKEAAQRELDFTSEISSKPATAASEAVMEPAEGVSMSRAVLEMVGDEWIAAATIIGDIRLNYKVTDQAVHVALNRWIKKSVIQRRGKRGHFSFRRRAPKEAREP